MALGWGKEITDSGRQRVFINLFWNPIRKVIFHSRKML
jgi:hypothetical protein